MRIICAWCDTLLGDDPNADALTTHTMCDACLDREMAALDETVSECPDTDHPKVKSNL